VTFFAISLLLYEAVRWTARIPRFGGPPGLPIVGNLWQIRHKDAPEQYRIWSRKYGPVYQIQLGNIPILVVNTAAAAKAIFIQNSQATASRPEFYTFHKVSRCCNQSKNLTHGVDHLRYIGHNDRNFAVH